MYRGGSVLVAGSAHLDVLAKITGDEVAIDVIGNVDIEIGGTALNIATNLAALGLKPRLLTALRQDSPYSGIILAHLHAHNVEVRVVNCDALKAAIFSAHIGADGEMLSAVSSMPVSTVVFTDEVVREVMQGTKCAILECNLSGVSINQFARIAFELNIPVFVASVSEEKSLRLSEVKYPIAAVFMNRREASYFGRRVVASIQPSVIASHLGCDLILSRGKDGVTIIQQGEEIHVPAPRLPENVHTLGAGDALLAETVAHHVFGGMQLADGVGKAVLFAAKIIALPNCNAGQGHAIEQALNSLDYMATRDQMTGLVNRGAGEQILASTHAKALLTNTVYSVLMVDIDHFKQVNDTYGHDNGDDAIKAVAEVLSNAVREIDTACRWGGEEFLCILQGSDVAAAMQVAERIRVNVEHVVIPIVGRITISVGIGVWQSAALDAAHVLKAADLGLYDAKQNGRNRIACAGKNS